jgi:hypothetical protein
VDRRGARAARHGSAMAGGEHLAESLLERQFRAWIVIGLVLGGREGEGELT